MQHPGDVYIVTVSVVYARDPSEKDEEEDDEDPGPEVYRVFIPSNPKVFLQLLRASTGIHTLTPKEEAVQVHLHSKVLEMAKRSAPSSPSSVPSQYLVSIHADTFIKLSESNMKVFTAGIPCAHKESPVWDQKKLRRLVRDVQADAEGRRRAIDVSDFVLTFGSYCFFNNEDMRCPITHGDPWAPQTVFIRTTAVVNLFSGVRVAASASAPASETGSETETPPSPSPAPRV